MLIPTALGKLHPAAAQAYKAGKLAWRFTGASTLGVLDGFLGYALTLNGKAKIFWSLWVIKYVTRKVLVKKTADHAAAWVAANRSGPSQAALRADLDRWLTTPIPPAHPAIAPPKLRRFFRRGAVPLTPADPTLRAGLAFLRDVLTRVAAGEEAVVARFARDDGSAGSHHVNVRAALGSLYGTAAGGRMVAALRDGGQDVALAGAIEEVYEELRTALRNDVIDLVVL